MDRYDRLSRAVEAGRYTVSGPTEFGQALRDRLARERAAANDADVPDDSVVLSVRVSAPVHAKLVAAAADHGVDIGSAARAALSWYLDGGADEVAVPGPVEPAPPLSPELRELLAEADEIYAASQVPADGLPVDPATVSMQRLMGADRCGVAD